MFGLSIRERGIEEMERRWARAPAVFGEEMLTSMERSVAIAEVEVVRRTPTSKRTTGGRLRGSIAGHVEGSGANLRGIIATHNVAYARWVEEDTRPHDIYPRHGRALAFAPVAGWQLVYRDPASGGRMGVRRLGAMAPELRRGLRVERGRALYERARVTRRTRNRFTTDVAQARRVVVRHVRHPGTTGQHMFRDGRDAAWPRVQEEFRRGLRRAAGRVRRR